MGSAEIKATRHNFLADKVDICTSIMKENFSCAACMKIKGGIRLFVDA